jgi:hypothetical protein
MGETEPVPPLDPTGQQLGQLYAVTDSGRFITFNRGASAPSTILPITGLQGTRRVAGLEVRFVDGSVLLLETSGNLYKLDPRTGVATLLGTSIFPVGSPTGVELIAGREELRVTGVDNNGVVFSGVVSGYDEPDRTLQVGLSVKRLDPLPNGITEIAGTQNLVACGDPSVLYFLNTDTDQLLVEQRPQGRRQLITVGPLRVDADATSGFEILQNQDRSDAAIAVLRVGGVTSLYDIDLNTGRASMVGAIPGLRQTERIIGLAAPPRPTSPTVRVGNMVAVTASNKLISFDDGAPQTLCRPPAPITGLSSDEHIVDIDTNPADGRVVALTDAARLYVISTAASSFASAALQAPLTASPGDSTAPFAGQINASFNIDFDPRTGLLTAVDRDLKRLSIDSIFGLVTTEAPLETFTLGRLPVIAYSGSFAPSPDSLRPTILNLSELRDERFSRADLSGSTGLLYRTNPTIDSSGSILEIIPTNGGSQRRHLIGGGEPVGGLTQITVERASVYGITMSNHLVTFRPSSPDFLDADLPITGLQGGEEVLAIDLSVGDNKLYALTNQERLYTLDLQSGQAQLSATLSAAPGDNQPFAGLSGSNFDIDFNPRTGDLRVVSETGQNLRVDAATGLTRTDTRVARTPPLPPLFSGIAYMNVASSDLSALFSLDTANERVANAIQMNSVTTTVRDLAIVKAFDTGVGSTGDVDVLDVLGLDFGPSFDQQYAIINTTQRPAAVYKLRDLTSFSDVPSSMLFEGSIALPQPGDQISGLAVLPLSGALGSGSTLLALLNGQSLLTMTTLPSAAANATLTPTVTAITGLPMEETLLSLEYRTSNSLVYALGKSGAIYTLNPTSGAATAVPNVTVALGTATKFDIDFNPSDQRLTILSNLGQLLFVDIANSGAIQTTAIAYGRATVAATAYRNNIADSDGDTGQFLIDTLGGTLRLPTLGATDAIDGSTKTQGVLRPFGAYQGFSSLAGFDIAGGADELSLAALQPTGAIRSSLYSVDLRTGRATLSGVIGQSSPPMLIRSLAVRIK